MTPEQVIPLLTLIIGCCVGAGFKENQLSYRLNLLRSHVDALKDRIELLEVEK